MISLRIYDNSELMTLDEAIAHAWEVADADCYNITQEKCCEEHRQLALWLEELKLYRNRDSIYANVDCSWK